MVEFIEWLKHYLHRHKEWQEENPDMCQGSECNFDEPDYDLEVSYGSRRPVKVRSHPKRFWGIDRREDITHNYPTSEQSYRTTMNVFDRLAGESTRAPYRKSHHPQKWKKRGGWL